MHPQPCLWTWFLSGLPCNVTTIFFAKCLSHPNRYQYSIQLKNLLTSLKMERAKGGKVFCSCCGFLFLVPSSVKCFKCIWFVAAFDSRSSGAAITRGLLEGANHCDSAQTHVTGVDQPFPGLSMAEPTMKRIPTDTLIEARGGKAWYMI